MSSVSVPETELAKGASSTAVMVTEAVAEFEVSPLAVTV